MLMNRVRVPLPLADGDSMRCTLHRPNPLRQTQKLDEPARIFLAVDLLALEGDHFLSVEGVRALAFDGSGLAFEEADGDLAVQGFGHFLGRGPEGFAQGGEPAAVVDELGEREAEVLAVMTGFAVEVEFFEGAEGFDDHGAAGGFVEAAGLHADAPIFDQVYASDAVAAGDVVELEDDLPGGERFTVE